VTKPQITHDDTAVKCACPSGQIPRGGVDHRGVCVEVAKCAATLVECATGTTYGVPELYTVTSEGGGVEFGDQPITMSCDLRALFSFGNATEGEVTKDGVVYNVGYCRLPVPTPSPR